MNNDEQPTLIIDGIGENLNKIFNTKNEMNFFVGNSGLSIRTILPVFVALLNNNVTCPGIRIDGVERMRQRPIGKLVDCLKKIGANISYTKNKGYPLILIERSEINLENDVEIYENESSQFLTGLLQAAPIFKRISKKPVIVRNFGELKSRPYVDLTIAVLKDLEL